MKLKIKRKKTFIVLIIIVLLAAGAIGYNALFKKPGAAAVVTASAQRKDIVQTVSVTGYIQANDTDIKTLGASQKVSKIFVKEGQFVKKGDVLAKLDTSDYDYQLKKAVINQDISSISNSNSIKQTQLDLKSANESLAEAQRKYDINKQLYDSGYISQEELITYEKTIQDVQNKIESLNNQLANLQTSSSTSQQGKQKELSAVEIQNLKDKIKESTVTANISGKVITMNLIQNQYPQQGNNEISIYDVSRLKVNVQLSQYDSVLLKAGQKVVVKPKGLSKTYSGTVTKIAETAQLVSSGTDKEAKVSVEITISDPDDQIKVGYEVDAVITLNEKKNAVSVNYEAVRQDKNGSKYIFIVENNKVVKRTVETGIETDFDIEVLKGLNEGDKYIPNPSETLKEGDIVTASKGAQK